MSTPIFKNVGQKINGVFSAADVTMLLNNKPDLGLLVQSINANYQLQVTRLYEINLGGGDGGVFGGLFASSSGIYSNSYLVVGRPNGTAQLARVLGPKATITQFYAQFGDPCQTCGNSIVLKLAQAFCDGNDSSAGQNAAKSVCSSGNQRVTYTMSDVLLNSVGISIQAESMVINEQCGAMFGNMEYDSQ